ncbi:MAG: hypothetical protein RhofKO_34720 [Rhodothermales bacterium]
MGPTELTDALRAVGELLHAEGTREAIVVVGGASLSLLGLVSRTTQDVDVIARLQQPGGDAQVLVHPEPMPPALVRAVQTVARDFGLPADWMNTDVALQWAMGLPPGFTEELVWRRYGGLQVGLAGRQTLIALKLFAAVDDGPHGVHVQDLVALAPTGDEFSQAAHWVRTQDASPVFQQMVGEVAATVLPQQEG